MGLEAGTLLKIWVHKGHPPAVPPPAQPKYSGILALNSGEKSRGLFTKDINVLWRVFKVSVMGFGCLEYTLDLILAFGDPKVFS